ncbi:cytochrome P450 [Nocardia sp. NPDC049149]|uniref:cytochrome P450 n=1 Tax=Nocardia sp. NPDC049149 TaxID=3364315 RepID=UPI00371636AC
MTSESHPTPTAPAAASKSATLPSSKSLAVQQIPKLAWWSLPKLIGGYARHGDDLPYRLFDRLGDVFEIELPIGFDLIDGVRKIVLFRDPDLVRPLFTALTTEINPTRANHILELLYGDRSLFLIDGDDHKRIRKLVLPRLRGNELNRWTEGLQHSITHEVATWPDAKFVPVQERILDVTLESILQITLGVSEAEMPRWKPAMHALLRTAASNQYILRYATRRIGGLKTWKAMHAMIAECDGLVYEEIARRAQDPPRVATARSTAAITMSVRM